jgi:hypothetical protein
VGAPGTIWPIVTVAVSVGVQSVSAAQCVKAPRNACSAYRLKFSALEAGEPTTQGPVLRSDGAVSRPEFVSFVKVSGARGGPSS